MFSLVSSAIQTAADVVSPSPSTVDQFVWHWNRIRDFYLDERCDQPRSPHVRLIEDTSVPRHLNEIMRILLEEDARLQQDEQTNRVANTQLSIGPCLEYVLQKRLLEMLCTLAEADNPPGTCLHVFLFLRRLIADCSVNLLGHNSILNSLQRLIAMCISVTGGPYERSQAEFLAVITLRLQTHRHLLQCFARDGFPLCFALLCLLTSPDNQVATEAADMLIVLVSIADSDLARLMIDRLPFTDRLSELLRDMHQAIPQSLSIPEIERFLNSLPETHELRLSSKTGFVSSDARKFLCFMRWLCFYDTLVQRCASQELSNALCSAFEHQFLQQLVRPRLISNDDQCPITSLQTFLLMHSLRNCISPQLLKKIQNFVFDRDEMERLFLQRCLSKRSVQHHSLCTHSLQLLEELLNVADVELVNRLLIQPILDRSYIDIQLYNLNADLVEFESVCDHQPIDDYQHLSNNSNVAPTQEQNSLNASKFKSLNYFIDLIPDELRSGPPGPDFGLQTYIDEAKRHFDAKLIECGSWNWPKSVTRLSSNPPKPFHEGNLLRMCFQNLQQLTHLSYETTLQVIAVVHFSKLRFLYIHQATLYFFFYR